MKRREFITLLSGIAAWPRASAAEDGKTVGVLVVGAPDPNVLLGVLRQGLREAGYTEGTNLQIDIRSAEASRTTSRLAAELVRRRVDVIIGFKRQRFRRPRKPRLSPDRHGRGDPVEWARLQPCSARRKRYWYVGSDSRASPKAIEYLKQMVPSFGARAVSERERPV